MPDIRCRHGRPDGVGRVLPAGQRRFDVDPHLRQGAGRAGPPRHPGRAGLRRGAREEQAPRDAEFGPLRGRPAAGAHDLLRSGRSPDHRRARCARLRVSRTATGTWCTSTRHSAPISSACASRAPAARPVVETYHTYFEEYVAHYLPWCPAGMLRFVARARCRASCAARSTI